MAERQAFSTRDINPNQRLDVWNGFVGRLLPGMVVDGPTSLRAACASRTIGSINVSRIQSQKALIQRWRQSDADSESEPALVHFQCSGSVVSFVGSQAYCIRPGDVCIKSDRGIPYTMDISDDNVVVLVDFQPGEIGISLNGPILELKRSPMSSALLSYALALLDEEEVVTSPDMLTTDEVATETFAEMLARFRSCEGIDIPPESEQFRRIARFIDRRLGDSALRPGMIADELSLSIRQVQRIFAPFGLTPSQYIYKRRVNLAAHILRSGPSRRSVTELAMELGFSDTAHMCRLFRRQIGISPMRYAAKSLM